MNIWFRCTKIAAALPLIVLFSSIPAVAQSGTRSIGGGSIGGGSGGFSGGGTSTGGFPTGTGSGNFASTSAEGYLRGRGALIRSAGQSVLHASEAAVNYETARRLRIQNHIAWQRARNDVIRSAIERRRLTREYYDARSRDRGGSRNSKSRSASFDTSIDNSSRTNSGNAPSTKVSVIKRWPTELKFAGLKSHRTKLETLLSVRAKLGKSSTYVDRTIRETAESARAILKKNVRRVSATEYLLGMRYFDDVIKEMSSKVAASKSMAANSRTGSRQQAVSSPYQAPRQQNSPDSNYRFRGSDKRRTATVSENLESPSQRNSSTRRKSTGYSAVWLERAQLLAEMKRSRESKRWLYRILHHYPATREATTARRLLGRNT